MTGATRPAARSGQTCVSTFARERALLRHAARAKRGSGDRQAPIEDGPQVELSLRPAHQADLHQPAVPREALDVPREVVAADDVEDDVDAGSGGFTPNHLAKSCVR